MSNRAGAEYHGLTLAFILPASCRNFTLSVADAMVQSAEKRNTKRRNEIAPRVGQEKTPSTN